MKIALVYHLKRIAVWGWQTTPLPRSERPQIRIMIRGENCSYNKTSLGNTATCVRYLMSNILERAFLKPQTLSRFAFYCWKMQLSHTPLCISMISGVCVQGVWNAQVIGQVTETNRLKVNSHRLSHGMISQWCNHSDHCCNHSDHLIKIGHQQ